MTQRADQKSSPFEIWGVIAARLFGPLVSFLIIILLARLWGPASLAHYTTIWAWLALSQHVSLFGLGDYVSKEVGRHPEHAAKYLSHGLLLIGANVFTCMVVLAVGMAFSSYSLEVKLGLAVAGLSLPAAAAIAMCQAMYTAFRKISYVVFSLAAENTIFLLGGLGVIFLGREMLMLIGALVAAKTVMAVVNLALVHRRIVPLTCTLDWPFGRSLLAGAVIFGLTGVAGLAFLRLDILILSLFCNMAAVGIYSAASKLLEIGLILPLAFYFVQLPVAARYFRGPSRSAPLALQESATDLFYLVLAVLGGGMLFAEPILGLLYGPAYYSSAGILRIMLIVFSVMSAETLLSMSCQAAGLHHTALYLALLRLVVGLVCQIIFIQKWNIAGAAWAALVAMLISFTFTWMVVEKKIAHFDWWIMLRKPLIACVPAFSVGWLASLRLSSFSAFLVYSMIYCLMYAVVQGNCRVTLPKNFSRPAALRPMD